MKYFNIENAVKPIARIVYGTSNAAFWKGTQMDGFLDELIKIGITNFDTAREYGESECVLGNWMESRGNRDKVVIITKGGHPAVFIPRLTERAIRKDFFTSCHKLKTDYVDIYLLHRDNPHKPAGMYIEILNALRAEGRIGAIGVSNWTHTRIEEANEYAYKNNLTPFTVSSPYFGLADMKGDPFGNGAVSIAGPNNAQAREWYRKNGFPILAYSVLGKGFFSGKVHSPKDMSGWARRGFATKENFERLRRAEEIADAKGCSVSQLALAWFYQNDLNVFATVSAISVDYMQQNIAALEIKLSEEEINYIDLIL